MVRLVETLEGLARVAWGEGIVTDPIDLNAPPIIAACADLLSRVTFCCPKASAAPYRIGADDPHVTALGPGAIAPPGTGGGDRRQLWMNWIGESPGRNPDEVD
jgi:hypothetical protein